MLKKIKFYFILFLIVIFHTFISISFSQIKINYYTVINTKDGLSGNNVYTIFQDSKGLIWMGTANGLDRYNGNKIINCSNPNDSNSPAQVIQSIAEDRSGNIWVAGNNNSIVTFIRESNKWVTHRLPIKYYTITGKNIIKIKIDLLNNVWILTDIGLIFKYNILNNNVYKYKVNVDNNDVYVNINIDINTNQNYILLPKFFHGFMSYKITNNNISIYNYEPINTLNRQLINTTIFDFMQYVPDKLIIYFKKWQEDKETKFILITDLKDSNNNNVIYSSNQNNELFSINVTKENIYFIDYPHIFIYDKSLQIKKYYKLNFSYYDSSIIKNIHSIFIDKTGVIWLCTGELGIIKINVNKSIYNFNSFANSNLYNFNNIRSIIFDHNNNLWFGTESGYLNKAIFNKNKISVLKKYYLNNGYPINAIANSKNKYILTSGEYQFDPYLFKIDLSNDKYASTNIPFYNFCYSIFEDNKNVLWFGDFLYLCYCKNSEIKPTKIKFKGKEIQFTYIWTIFQDSENGLWVGTNIGLIKINKYKTGIEKLYQTKENDLTSLSGTNVWQIIEEKPGILWIATSDGGLNRFDKKTGKFIRFTTNDGLPSNMITGLLMDDHGNLWISTAKGISKFNIKNHIFINFNEADGLLSNDFNFKACAKSRDGWMFWGTKKGIIYFHPDSIKTFYNVPLLISSFKVFDKEIKDVLIDKETIRLKYYEKCFSFEPTMPDYSNPLKHRFEYILAGFDKKWQITNEYPPLVSYTNIPPGHYILRVRTANFDDDFKRKEIAVNIIIMPAFWQTIFFKTLILIFGLAFLSFIIILIYWNYKSKKKVLQSEIESLRMQMNPHFIFNTLNSIQDYIMENEKKNATHYLSKFARLMRMILENSKDTFISIEKENDFLSVYLELESLRFNNLLEYEIKISENVNLINDKIPAMLLQPIIENSIKHGLSPKKDIMKLVVNIDADDDLILCSVIDNGIGRKNSENNKDPNSNHKSYGIEIIRNRLEIFTKVYDKNYSITITDLIDNQNLPIGTKVNLFLGKL